MNTTKPTPRIPPGNPPPAPLPYRDAPSARIFLTALGDVYREAGLPPRLAAKAACADYRSFGLPTRCDG
jgi:hypothetical protein